MILPALLCVITLSSMRLNAEILVSDPANKSASFLFNVDLQGEYLPTGRLFVTAPQALKGNTFAVAAVYHNSQVFQGLTPETVTLDGMLSLPNPLYGAAIERAALLGAQFVVITRTDPSSLFLVDDQNSTVAVYSAHGIRDALKKRATSFLNMTTNATTVFSSLDSQAQRIAFVAVSNGAGRFDGEGSGIAVLFFKRFETKDKKSFFAWDSIDAVTGDSQYSKEGILENTGNKAFPFGKTSPELFITTPAITVEAVTDMYFDRDLGMLYITLQAQGAAGTDDGVRGLILASCRNGKLQLQAIAPDSVFGKDAIVGGRGSSTAVSLYKVRTMQTRTYLRYAVIVGGVGESTDLKRQVSALPLVDNLASSAHGGLASVNSIPATIFLGGTLGRFGGRVYAVPAANPSDVYTSTSSQARVGGLIPLPGAISDIVVHDEAVFVSVEQADEGLQPGIFYSQPLFDTEGRISGWTNWQRVAGTGNPVRRFFYNPYRATFEYLAVGAKNSTQSVFRTAFTDGSDPLGLFIAAEFPQVQGGVQGLFDFPVTTQSFSTVTGKRLAVQAYGGYKKVVLLQTGKDSSGLFGPLQAEPTVYTSTNGMLGDVSDTTAFSFSGGVLDTLGPLSSSVVLTDGTNGWFVVGGSGGVALLADDQGRGWDAKRGLENGFKGLSSGMKWHSIQNIADVRKLIAFEGRLFILTDDKLLRCEVTADRIATDSVSSTVIASSALLG
ncbi:hypothetical protein H0W26_05885, partial [Candidatus Dependentiae bacterium]|nr:hypothetical protein [Candidatus Dependentiae bacterium]